MRSGQRVARVAGSWTDPPGGMTTRSSEPSHFGENPTQREREETAARGQVHKVRDDVEQLARIASPRPGRRVGEGREQLRRGPRGEHDRLRPDEVDVLAPDRPARPDDHLAHGRRVAPDPVLQLQVDEGPRPRRLGFGRGVARGAARSSKMSLHPRSGRKRHAPRSSASSMKPTAASSSSTVSPSVASTSGPTSQCASSTSGCAGLSLAGGRGGTG